MVVSFPETGKRVPDVEAQPAVSAGRSGLSGLLFALALCFLAAPAAAGLEEGKQAYREGNYAQALQEFLPLAEAGDITVQNQVAAMPDRRVVLVTGEGSHQMTVQEISQFDRFGLKPIIFCLNNQGYLIERLLCKDPMIAYNDLPQWNYAQLPQALGLRNWFTARVTTNGELDAAMRQNLDLQIEIAGLAPGPAGIALAGQPDLGPFAHAGRNGHV